MEILKKRSCFGFVLLFTQLVCAQEAISVSAGEASGSGGSSSYNVSQVFYTTNTGTAGSLSQGVQQPFEFQILSNLELYC